MSEELQRTKEGTIKDFSVPNAHHLYVQVVQISTGKLIKKEAVALREPSELRNLHQMRDKDDGYILGKKYAINDDVIKALLENGDCIQLVKPGLRFEYVLKPMRNADNLKHKG